MPKMDCRFIVKTTKSTNQASNAGKNTFVRSGKCKQINVLATRVTIGEQMKGYITFCEKKLSSYKINNQLVRYPKSERGYCISICLKGRKLDVGIFFLLVKAASQDIVVEGVCQ